MVFPTWKTWKHRLVVRDSVVGVSLPSVTVGSDLFGGAGVWPNREEVQRTRRSVHPLSQRVPVRVPFPGGGEDLRVGTGSRHEIPEKLTGVSGNFS